jgi:glutamate dehydrogenase
MIVEMEKAGQLDRTVEAMPTEDELDARAAAGLGLTSPELAVLLAYAKITVAHEVVTSTLPDEAWTDEVLTEYFPSPLRGTFADQMAGHRLRRDIITTAVVNEAVNRGGISFLFRNTEETGADAAETIRAFHVVREVYGLRNLWRRVSELDNQVPTVAQTTVTLDLRRLVDRAVRHLVMSRRAPIDVTAEIARLRPGVAALLPTLDRLFQGREREAMQSHIGAVAALGIPADLAHAATCVTYGFGLIDVVDVAAETGQDLVEVAGVYFVLSERFGVDSLLSRISALPREDRWQSLARMALRYDLYGALTALTREVLPSAAPADPIHQVEVWERTNATAIERTRTMIREFDDSRTDLAALSVVLRQIRTLVQTTSPQRGE